MMYSVAIKCRFETAERNDDIKEEIEAQLGAYRGSLSHLDEAIVDIDEVSGQ